MWSFGEKYGIFGDFGLGKQLNVGEGLNFTSGTNFCLGYFSPWIIWFFTCLSVSVAEQRFWSWQNLTSFLAHVLKILSKNISLKQRPRMFPVFYLFLHLPCTLHGPSELTFVKSVVCIKVQFLHMNGQFSCTICLKDYSFSPQVLNLRKQTWIHYPSHLFNTKGSALRSIFHALFT